MKEQNVNSNFFGGAYKHAWKRTIPEGLTEAEADFILDIAGLKVGSRVWDIMCGYGRHALALARKKISILATDNLPEYIQEIRTVSEREALPVEAFCIDIMDADPDGKFDAVICMGNSFNFFNKEDALTLLQRISSKLEKGGILLINSWTIAEISLKHFRDREWHYAGEYKCVIENSYRFYPARIESEQTVISPDGSVEILKGIDYIFTLDELQQMFLQAGLSTKALYSTPKKRKFSLGDVRVYLVAEKL